MRLSAVIASMFSLFRKDPRNEGHDPANPAGEKTASGPTPLNWKQDRLASLGAHLITQLQNASSDTYMEMDVFMRAPRVTWYLEGDYEVPRMPIFGNTEGIASLDADQVATFMNGLISMHRDGRIREQYVGLLSADASPQALPFLLVRSMDWVPEIALAARAAIASRLRDNARPFAQFAALISRIEKTERCDPVLMRELRRSLAQSPSVLTSTFSNAPARDQLGLLGLAMDLPRGPRHEIAMAALSMHADVKLRRNAALVLLDRSDGEPPAELVRTLVRDRSGQIAAIALTYCDANRPVDFRQILIDALFHPARSVASMAGVLLRRRFEEEPADILRGERSRPGGRIQGAMKALVKFGDQSDVAPALPFLQSTDPALAAAAFKLIAEKDTLTYLPLILEKLETQGPMQRIAIGTLRRRASAIDASILLPLLDHRDTIVVRAAFGILLDKGNWVALKAILRAFNKTELHVDAKPALEHWLARLNRAGGGRPDRITAAEIAEQLEKSPSVPDTTRRLIQLMIA